ncbi:MAG: c-type cytochrome [Gammaproteobacteria bacterium]|nr:c-type cytochrome [Gammaproteobacteria bacterium]
MLSTYSRVAVSAVRAVAVIAFFSAQIAHAEGDIERGRVLADTCKGCHAVDSYNNVYPTYHVPRIGGQSADYLIEALKLYRDGKRDHQTMTAQAASYDDQEIADIAAYLTSVVPPLEAAQPVGTAPNAATTCKACHGETGIGQISIYPYLAGQHKDYLLQALYDYKNGARQGVNATVMQANIMALSDAELDVIAEYYSRQDGLSAVPMD